MHQADLAQAGLRVVAGWAQDGGDADQTLVMAEALAPPAGGSVLDVGFGRGEALERLARRHPLGLIAGVDSSEPRVRAARRRLADMPGTVALDLRCADPHRLPFADASFDLAFATDAYRGWPDPAGAVAEMAAVLRPGGELVLSFVDIRTYGGFEPPRLGAKRVCLAVAELSRLGLSAEVEEIVHSDARATFLVRARKAKL